MAVNNQNEALALLSDISAKLQELSEYVRGSQSAQTEVMAEVPPVEAPPSDYEQLIALLESPEWPEAAPPCLICRDGVEQDKHDRAEGVLDFLAGMFSGTLLDFGCGEGHITHHALSYGYTKAVGYDIEQKGQLPWDQKGDWFLTTNLDKVRGQAPYDAILVFDVLDHAQDPVQALRTVREMAKPETKIFVRCHPWMSRHASHLYLQKNKAFLHLVFTEEELAKMGLKMPFVQKVFYPIDTYKKWFLEADLKVVSENVQSAPVEKFFEEVSLVRDRLPLAQYGGTFPNWQMSQAFVDFVLTLP